jgi:hypothetical protein
MTKMALGELTQNLSRQFKVLQIAFQVGIEIPPLADGNRGAVLLIVAPNGCGIGLALINRDLFRHSVPTIALVRKCLAACSLGAYS